MHNLAWRVATLFVLVFGAVAGSAAGVACGQTQASCQSICAFPDAPATCDLTCTEAQSACVDATCASNFQSFLTCVGNAGDYASVHGACASAAKAAGVGDYGYGIGVDAGPGGDASSASCDMATCATVCASEPALAKDCTSGCEQNQALCAGSPGTFQALLTCFCNAGGLMVDSGEAMSQCDGQIAAVQSTCPAPTPVPDAATGG